MIDPSPFIPILAILAFSIIAAFLLVRWWEWRAKRIAFNDRMEQWKAAAPPSTGGP